MHMGSPTSSQKILLVNEGNMRVRDMGKLHHISMETESAIELQK